MVDRFLCCVVVAFVLSSCTIPVLSHVVPEALLRTSSERVSFVVTDMKSVDVVADWIKDDRPTGAVFSCTKEGVLCDRVHALLQQYNIPLRSAQEPGTYDVVVLLYDRVAAKDCHSSRLGCAVSVNAVQMVADHQQFVRPNLSDMQDADRAVTTYRNYME